MNLDTRRISTAQHLETMNEISIVLYPIGNGGNIIGQGKQSFIPQQYIKTLPNLMDQETNYVFAFCKLSVSW